MSFQSHGNLEEKCEKKIEHFVPFNKNCDITSRTCIYSIFKSYVIQTFVTLIVTENELQTHLTVSSAFWNFLL